MAVDFQPGAHVFAKRRRKPIFEVVRRVGDSDGFEVKTRDGVVRFFWGSELDLAPNGSKISAVVDINAASQEARTVVIKQLAEAKS